MGTMPFAPPVCCNSRPTRGYDMNLYALSTILADADSSHRDMIIVMGILVGIGLLIAMSVGVIVWRDDEWRGGQDGDARAAPGSPASPHSETAAARSQE